MPPVTSSSTIVSEPRTQWARCSLLTRHFAVALVQELSTVDDLAPAFSTRLAECLRDSRLRRRRRKDDEGSTRVAPTATMTASTAAAPPTPQSRHSPALQRALHRDRRPLATTAAPLAIRAKQQQQQKRDSVATSEGINDRAPEAPHHQSDDAASSARRSSGSTLAEADLVALAAKKSVLSQSRRNVAASSLQHLLGGDDGVDKAAAAATATAMPAGSRNRSPSAAARRGPLRIMSTPFPPDRLLPIEDFVLCVMLRLRQLAIVHFKVPPAWQLDPCEDLDPEEHSMEVVVRERVARWVRECTAAWQTHSPLSIGGNIDYFSDETVLKYCLIDLFRNIDFAREGLISWLQFVTYLADSSSMSSMQRSITQVQLLLPPQRARHRQLTQMRKVTHWKSRNLAVVLSVTRSGTETLKLLSTSNFTLERQFVVSGKHGNVISIDVIDGLDFVACAFYDGVRLYDFGNWVCKAFLREVDPVTVLRWIPTMRRLATGTRAGGVRLYDISNVDRLFYARNEVVQDVDFEERRNHTETVTDILPVTPNNSVVTAAMDNSIVFSHNETRSVRRLCGAVSLGMVHVDVHGLIFAFGVDPVPMVWVYNVPTAKPISLGGKGTTPHVDRIIGVKLLSDHNYGASMDRKGCVKIWDLWELACVQSIDVTQGDLGAEFLTFYDFYYSEGDRRLVTAAKDKTYQLSYNDKDEKRKILQASFEPIVALLLLEVSGALVTVTERSVCYWNLVTLRPMHTFENVVGEVITAAAADEPTRQLFLGTRGGQVHTLSLGNATIRKSFAHSSKRPVSTMIYIADIDMLIACVGTNAVAVTQFDMKEFKSSTTTLLQVAALGFHAREKVLLIAEESGIVSVWRLSLGVSIRWDRVCACDASPDGGAVLGVVPCTDCSSFFVYDSVGLIQCWDIVRFKKELVVPHAAAKASKRRRQRRRSTIIPKAMTDHAESPNVRAGGVDKTSANSDNKSQRVEEEDESIRCRLATRWLHRRRHSASVCPIVTCALLESPYPFLYVADEAGSGTVYDVSRVKGVRMIVTTFKNPSSVTDDELLRLSAAAATDSAERLEQQQRDHPLEELNAVSFQDEEGHDGRHDNLGDFIVPGKRLPGDARGGGCGGSNECDARKDTRAAIRAAVAAREATLQRPAVPKPLSLDARERPVSSSACEGAAASTACSTACGSGSEAHCSGPSSPTTSPSVTPRSQTPNVRRGHATWTGRYVISVTHRDPDNPLVEVYNLAARQLHQDPITDLRVLPSAPRCVFSSSRDGHVKIWTLFLGRCAGTLSLGDVNTRANQLFVRNAGDNLSAAATAGATALEVDGDLLDDVPFPYNERRKERTEASRAAMQPWERKHIAPILCSDATSDRGDALKLDALQSLDAVSEAISESEDDEDETDSDEDDGDAGGGFSHGGAMQRQLSDGEGLQLRPLASNGAGESAHFGWRSGHTDVVSDNFSFSLLRQRTMNASFVPAPVAPATSGAAGEGTSFFITSTSDVADAAPAPRSKSMQALRRRTRSRFKRPGDASPSRRRLTVSSLGMTHQEQVLLYQEWVAKQEGALRRRFGEKPPPRGIGEAGIDFSTDLLFQVMQQKKAAASAASAAAAAGDAGRQVREELFHKRDLRVGRARDQDTSTRVAGKLTFAGDRQLLYMLHSRCLSDVVEEIINDPSVDVSRDRITGKLLVVPKPAAGADPAAAQKSESAGCPLRCTATASPMLALDPDSLEPPSPSTKMLEKVRADNVTASRTLPGLLYAMHTQQRGGSGGASSAFASATPETTMAASNVTLAFPPQVQATLRQIERRAECVRARHDFKLRLTEEGAMSLEDKAKRSETVEQMPRDRYMAELGRKARDAEAGREVLVPARVFRHEKRTLWRRPEERVPVPKFDRAAGGAETNAKVPKYVPERSGAGAGSGTAGSSRHRHLPGAPRRLASGLQGLLVSAGEASPMTTTTTTGGGPQQHSVEMVRRAQIHSALDHHTAAGGGGQSSQRRIHHSATPLC